MLSVTTGVEFSFNDVMYKQVDGVAMGSPLGPVLANIFVGYCECKIDESLWPAFYVRFVDDSFTHFDSVESSELFLDVLNSLHYYYYLLLLLLLLFIIKLNLVACARIANVGSNPRDEGDNQPR